MGNYSNVKQYTGAPQKGAAPTLAQMLKQNLTAIRSALPKHMTPERVCRIALNFIAKNPTLQRCSAQSLCGAIMEASSLGLEIDMRGLAYLVPYGNTAQLIIGYKGMVDLALRSGKVKQIYADVIGENDEYDIIMGLNPELIHKPNLRGRGEIIAAYAIAVMADGSKQFVVVPREDIDKIKQASKSGNSGPWVQWYNSMALKTAVKRLCKLLPLSPEMQRATAIDDQADAGVAQQFDYDVEVISPSTQPEAAPEPVAQQEEPKQEAPQEQFDCPASNKKVTEADCEKCQDKPHCKMWEAL